MIRVLKYKPFAKNTLVGFVDLELGSGVIIRGFTWHRKNDREWIGLPACRWQADDGSTQWAPIIEFTDGKTRRQFQEQAVAAVHVYLGNEERVA